MNYGIGVGYLVALWLEVLVWALEWPRHINLITLSVLACYYLFAEKRKGDP